MNKLLIWNLPDDVSEDHILAAFEKNCVARVDHYVGKYAILTFDQPQQAEDALNEWNGKLWRGSRIRVRFADY